MRCEKLFNFLDLFKLVEILSIYLLLKPKANKTKEALIVIKVFVVNRKADTSFGVVVLHQKIYRVSFLANAMCLKMCVNIL